LPVARALAIVTGVARVLDAVHALGVVHRDLKPSNVFLCDAGGGIDVRLLDFGIAQVSGQIDELVLTVSGDVVGSPGYLAPEQVLDDPSAVGPRTDVFALTALAYRLFTGHPAFVGRSLAAAAYQAAFVDPAPASGVCRDLPRALDRVLADGLAKAPERRPGSAGEVAAALAAALGEPQR
jgi:serine/threonine-protein kinase